MVKISICVSFLLVVGARSEWSWGKNSQAAIDKPVSAEKITELEATPEAKTDIAVGRSLDVSGVSGAPNVPGSGFGGVSGLPGNSNFHGVSGHSNFQADLNIPNGAVLPLEEHSSYSSVPKLKENTEEGVLSEQEEGRSGRFLGISEKLCKLGVKGMCGETKGYPIGVASHYEDSLGAPYANYPPYPEGNYASYYPSTNMVPPKKPFKKFFNDIFNKKKLKGALPQQTYGVPSQPYYPPSKGYGLPQTTYKQPINSYGPPKPLPSYSAPLPKPHYIKPKPIYSAPKPIYSNKQHFPVFTPKPTDVLIHEVKGQHSIPTPHLAGVHPTKVEHIHTHTHIYKQTPPFDIRDGPPSFPRDGSYHSASQIKTVVDRNLKDSVFGSKDFPPVNPKDPFTPSQSIPFIRGFPSNQDKRHISTNSFESFGTKEQQTFQTSIDKLANSFANNGLPKYYPVDCQCVRHQYCAPQDLVARSDPNEIGHLLDARNEPSEVLSNVSIPQDYYDYDYLRINDEIYDLENETSVENSTIQDVDYATEEIPTTSATTHKRVRRSSESQEKSNSTEDLQGRQLNGFTPGINGCGNGYVCCRRPVYIAAKRSEPTCGRGNPSIHGRVSSFQYEQGQSDFGEYPWQAAILRDEGTESMFVCGATLIDNLHVLTAAHCVNDLKVQDLKVRLGEWDVNRDTEFYKYIEIKVVGIFVHPEFYKGNLYNDIAVVRLADYVDINGSPHISPICLPAPNTDFTHYKCHVTGWGKDAFGDKGRFQHILKELEVPVIDHQTCEHALRQTRLGTQYKLHEGFICAGGEEGKDACKGDGGGPLVCSVDGRIFQLGGIVSWGIGCGQKGIPGVYVNIPHYVDWIRFTTRL